MKRIVIVLAVCLVALLAFGLSAAGCFVPYDPGIC
jgi:hypothetical protein